ncbi:MAG: hypothetical protein PHH26_00525 [Candidatus Thermoplasmatota archaeon]|nr:hypothetical protein [Candidatus Thermoplasmatota archaeon]
MAKVFTEKECVATSKISSGNKLFLPIKVAEELDIQPGDEMGWFKTPSGLVVDKIVGRMFEVAGNDKKK